MKALERVTPPSPSVTDALGSGGPRLGAFCTQCIWRQCRRVQVLQSQAEIIHWTRTGEGWSPALNTPPPVVRWGLVRGSAKPLKGKRVVCLCVLSQLSRVWLFVTPWTVPPPHPRLLCLWNFPGKNTGVGCHFLLEGIFLTQGSNLCLLCSCTGRQIPYHSAMVIPKRWVHHLNSGKGRQLPETAEACTVLWAPLHAA